MALTWLYSMGSVVIVSLVSFVGLLTLSISDDKLKKVLIYMIAFSAGALFGDAFIHLLPEVVEEAGFGLNISLYVLSGIAFSFIVEKIIHWNHCHHPTTKDHPHPFAYLNLFGDGVHNFIDGLIIAAAYMVSIPVGVATTLAVVLHEIPQEIGDFGLLLHKGLKRAQVLLVNVASAAVSLAGALLTYLIGESIQGILPILLSLAAGFFIYIALSDLIPEIHSEDRKSVALTETLLLLIGVLVIWGSVLFLEG